MNIEKIIEEIYGKCPELTEQNILKRAEATRKYGNNTFGADHKVDLAVMVTKREHIGQILLVANQIGFCVCPLSTGNNWGYGSVNPIDDRALVVIDLFKLNQIIEIDKEDGLIAIEPGVTQEQLAQYLEQNDWDYMAPTTGAGPNCSVLSNALERGYGPSIYTDHFSATMSMRYYIGHPDYCTVEHCSAIQSLDEEVTKNNHSLVDSSHKYGLGPYLDGLFTQSNLGIVTEISIRLGPIPEKFCSFFIKCKHDSDFEPAVEFIKRLLKDKSGELGIVNLMDRRRVVSMLAGNPNNTRKHANMTTEQVERIAKRNDVAEWLIMGSIYTTKDGLKTTKRYIKSHTKFASALIFSDSLKVPFGHSLIKLMIKVTSWKLMMRLIMCFAKRAGKKIIKFKMMLKRQLKQIHSLASGKDIMLGKPQQVALPLAYWRNPDKNANIETRLSPDKDSCGLLWYAPLVPMNAGKMRDFVNFVRNTTPEFGIEPLITFSHMQYLDSTVPIIFNIKDPSAIKLAHACASKLFDEGLKQGFVPYRLSTKMQSEKLDSKASQWQMTDLIKKALDPNNTINPNRYNPKPLDTVNIE